LALAMTATVIGAARRALARAHPGISKQEIDILFVELHYGSDLADGLRRALETRR